MIDIILLISFIMSLTLIYINADIISTNKKQHKKMTEAKKVYLYFNYIISFITMILIGLYFTS